MPTAVTYCWVPSLERCLTRRVRPSVLWCPMDADGSLRTASASTVSTEVLGNSLIPAGRRVSSVELRL